MIEELPFQYVADTNVDCAYLSNAHPSGNRVNTGRDRPGNIIPGPNPKSDKGSGNSIRPEREGSIGNTCTRIRLDGNHMVGLRKPAKQADGAAILKGNIRKNVSQLHSLGPRAISRCVQA